MRYWPAGLVFRIEPAGEMWSVVMLVSQQAQDARAAYVAIGPGVRAGHRVRRAADVGRLGLPANDRPPDGRLRQRSSPWNTWPYSL